MLAIRAGRGEHRRQATDLRTAYRRVYDASVSAGGAKMAKEPKTPKSEAETPFQRFQRLARKIVAASKDKAQNDDPQPQS